MEERDVTGQNAVFLPRAAVPVSIFRDSVRVADRDPYLGPIPSVDPRLARFDREDLRVPLEPLEVGRTGLDEVEVRPEPVVAGDHGLSSPASAEELEDHAIAGVLVGPQAGRVRKTPRPRGTPVPYYSPLRQRTQELGEAPEVLFPAISVFRGVHRGGRVEQWEQMRSTHRLGRPATSVIRRTSGSKVARAWAPRVTITRGRSRETWRSRNSQRAQGRFNAEPVIRGPTLDDVQDAKRFPLESQRVDRSVEPLPGPPHERNSGEVFRGARGLPHEHHPGRGPAPIDHNMVTGPMERASRAGLHLPRQRCPPVGKSIERGGSRNPARPGRG